MFRTLLLVGLVALVPLVALGPAAACSDHGCPPRPEYYATGFATLVTGIVGSTFVCLSGDCETNGGTGLGGGYAPATQPYVNAIGRANDELWGVNSALWLCAGPDDGGCVATTDIGCGARVLLGSPEPFDAVIGHVLVLHVGPGTEVCGGSRGDFVADFF